MERGKTIKRVVCTKYKENPILSSCFTRQAFLQSEFVSKTEKYQHKVNKEAVLVACRCRLQTRWIVYAKCTQY